MVGCSNLSGRSYPGSLSVYLVISCIWRKYSGVILVSLFIRYLGDTFTSAVAYPGQKQLLVGDTGLICLIFLLLIVVLKYFVFNVRVKIRDNKD